MIEFTLKLNFVLGSQQSIFLQFPIIKLVWSMHNNTDSTYFSHFWSNLGWRS